MTEMVCGVHTIDPDGVTLCPKPQEYAVHIVELSKHYRVCTEHVGAMVVYTLRQYDSAIVTKLGG